MPMMEETGIRFIESMSELRAELAAIQRTG